MGALQSQSTQPDYSLINEIKAGNASGALRIIKENKIDFSIVSNTINCKMTALMQAIYENMPDVALALIATKCSNPGYANGKTALIMACSRNMPTVALALIATGCSNPGYQYIDTDWGYEKYETALTYACSNEMPEVALALIATGESNPGALVYRYGKYTPKIRVIYSAIILAIEHNLTDVLDLLVSLDYPKQIKDLDKAITYDMPDVAIKLIQHKLDVSDISQNILINACIHSMPLEVVSYLLKLDKVYPEKLDKDLNTALIYACKNNMPEIALALIETGNSNPKRVNYYGETALSWAQKNNMTPVIDAIHGLLSSGIA